MGASLLHLYDGKEAFTLFNGNFEALFNHIQVRDTLYYFSIERDAEQEVYEEYRVSLNRFQITDDAKLDNTDYVDKIETLSVTRN